MVLALRQPTSRIFGAAVAEALAYAADYRPITTIDADIKRPLAASLFFRPRSGHNRFIRGVAKISLPLVRKVASQTDSSSEMMNSAAAFTYLIIVCLWSAVLVTVAVAFSKHRRTLGTGRLLLIVVTIDTLRNIVENIYFGAYFGAQYGILPSGIGALLSLPYLLIIPKLLNVVAAVTVLVLLLFRWLPLTQRERAKTDRMAKLVSDTLRREVEEHRRLFETSVDLIVVTDRDRIVKRISRSCEAVLGYSPESLVNSYGGDLVKPEALELLRVRMEASIGGAEPGIQDLECEFRHKDGHWVPIGISGVWSEEAERFFLIGRDMTAAKQTSMTLRRLAHYDALTALPNRISLVQYLEERLADPKGSLVVVMFDLDGFKDVNDSLGHEFGNALLQRVPERLLHRAPRDTRLYRFGGDEFFAVFEIDDPLAVYRVVDDVLSDLREPFDIDEHRVVIGASAGVAFGLRDASSAEDLLANVDLALYAAKSAGRGKTRSYSPLMRASAYARLELNKELRRAMSDREFILHFQPQFRLSDKSMVGVEALLRWNHPVRGLLPPNLFIEALADGPYANDVGDWILDESCKAISRWRADGRELRVAVNLFACQFADGKLVARVKQALERWQLPPHALELEITENIVLGSDANLASLRLLRELGVQVAFDDFGTGYASLSCIATYPITRIKIDRSFVRNIDEGSSVQDTAIASSIILLAHNLGLSVTAEGVETSAQEAFLRRRNCDEVQGFKYAKPLPPGELERVMSKSGGCERRSA
ncbi:putative bifunctional diguanylate cyclase/phosphodiesterase [Tardiphaga sp.]|jgi:diguanylate cyclase (GGDEF)-like protein/PAS domain S-box-containing protein|uniref:putative bifunctional diguanylate cyclase/phosphodiesterase n=1 Tax=Tardiphaga sp. TaxID=1926292 RepID=UPI0037D9EFFA